MISSISPALSSVSTSIRPEDLLLKENSWVKFTSEWPDTHKWVVSGAEGRSCLLYTSPSPRD